MTDDLNPVSDGYEVAKMAVTCVTAFVVFVVVVLILLEAAEKKINAATMQTPLPYSQRNTPPTKKNPPKRGA